MRTLDDFKATLSTPGCVPTRLARQIAPAVTEHHRVVFDGMDTQMLRPEQVASILVKRGSNVGLTELHSDVWSGLARTYDIPVEVVLSESPATIRLLIDLRAARLALRRAEDKRAEADKTIERNRRRIGKLTVELPPHLIEMTS